MFWLEADMRIVLFFSAAGLAAAGAFWMWSGEGARSAVEPKPQRGAQVVTVKTAPALSGEFVRHLKTIGWVEPEAQVAIKSRIDSQVMDQQVKDGQMVKKGDTLFTLDDRELNQQLAKDKAMLAKDQAVAKRVEADLARARDLLGKGASTQQAVDQSQADAASAAANIASDEAAIRLDETKLSYTRIAAPIDGRAGVVAVSPGNLVKAADQTSLVTITQISPIRVTFPLPSRELAAVKARLGTDRPPAIRVFASGSTEVLASGKVSFIDSVIDTASGTLTAKADLDNADGHLWPGMAVDVEVETGAIPDAIQVPTVAVQSGQSSSFAFVVQPDQSVAVRPVKVIASEGDVAAVSGLTAGDQVVTDGQARLSNGAKVRLAGETKPDDKAGGKSGGKAGVKPAAGQQS
jgi:multidrug efflux system membrane fusion protein